MLFVGLWYVYRSVVECAAPRYHAVVEVRVREADALNAAKSFHGLDRLIVQIANAIVKNVAAARLHEERALAYGEAGRNAYACKPWLLFSDFVLVSSGLQFGHRRPLLTLPAYVLPRVIAYRTISGRTFALRVLYATGLANKVFHRVFPKV